MKKYDNKINKTKTTKHLKKMWICYRKWQILKQKPSKWYCEMKSNPEGAGILVRLHSLCFGVCSMVVCGSL